MKFLIRQIYKKKNKINFCVIYFFLILNISFFTFFQKIYIIFIKILFLCIFLKMFFNFLTNFAKKLCFYERSPYLILFL